jgi:integrase family protein|nr:MAG TPA: Integrase [Caudoviricetes sp.]
MFFYLKEPRGDKDTIIIIQYYISDEKKIFKYSTGEVISPNDWDFNARMPKSRKGADGVRLRKIAAHIMQYNDFLVTLIDNYKLNGEKITREKLKNAFDAKFKPERVTNDFEYFTDFISDFLSSIKGAINKSTGKEYSKARVYVYNQSMNALINFENYSNKRIRIDEYNSQLNDAFVSFCANEKKFSSNTIGELVSGVKVLLRKAKEKGYTIANDLGDFTKTKEESISVVLSEDEIERLVAFDFSNDKRLENARDLMILGIWTGLRVSDVMNLPSIDPDSKFIEVEPQKTRNTSGAKVVIPLHHHIKDMIRKRGMPTPLNNSYFNKFVKEVCRIVGFNNDVEGTLMNPKTRRKERGVFKKWQLISSHTCRRSFATNLYLMNFPTLSIMKITGHTTEASFLKYIKVTPKEHAERLLAHWEAYYKDKEKAPN